jgi:hypothetical protein
VDDKAPVVVSQIQRRRPSEFEFGDASAKSTAQLIRTSSAIARKITGEQVTV